MSENKNGYPIGNGMFWRLGDLKLAPQAELYTGAVFVEGMNVESLETFLHCIVL